MLKRSLIMWVFLGLSLGTPSPTYSQISEFPNYPEADLSVENIIDAITAVTIAAIRARELWGNVQAGEPILCSDIDGIINFYMVPFRIGAEKCPAKDDMFIARLQTLHRSHEIVEEYQQKLEQLNGDLPVTDIDGQESNGTTGETLEPTVEQLKRPAGAAALLESMNRAISALDTDTKYGTVLVSARKAMYPIPAVFHYVPPFFVSGLQAKQIAARILKAPNCRLSNLVVLHPGEMYYKFEIGDSYTFVNCKTLRSVENPGEFERKVHDYAAELSKAAGSGGSAADSENVADEWNRLLKAIQED